MAPTLESCLVLYFPGASLASLDLSALLDPACMKVVVSKALGYAIVAGSALVKMPQLTHLKYIRCT